MTSQSDFPPVFQPYLEYDADLHTFEWVTDPLDMPPLEDDSHYYIEEQQDALEDFVDSLKEKIFKPDITLDRYNMRMIEYIQQCLAEVSKSRAKDVAINRFIVPTDMAILYFVFQSLGRMEDGVRREWSADYLVEEDPVPSKPRAGPVSGTTHRRKSRSERPAKGSSRRRDELPSPAGKSRQRLGKAKGPRSSEDFLGLFARFGIGSRR